MGQELNAYEIELNRKVRVTIPEQYKQDTMFINGVETRVMTHTSPSVVVGTFKGMPKATSGFYFLPDKPNDGTLHLLDINTPIREVATLSDMIKQA